MKLAKLSSLAAGLLLVACFALHAQQAPRAITLQVVALNSAGQPVPDLTEPDFKVFDNGVPQRIASFRQNQTDGSHALVILFDLLNASTSSRGEVWNYMKTDLSHLLQTKFLYLYLLVDDGSLYPVHALSAEGDRETGDPSWLDNIGPLLDSAMRKTNRLRPQEFSRDTMDSVGERFNATLRALEEMRARMAAVPGPKDLLWITYGIPSSMLMVGGGRWDGTPMLRQAGAEFSRCGITLYSADPGIDLERGLLERDGLDILTGATGGYAFGTVDVKLAVERIEAGARTNYTIEYQPPAKNWNGKYHKLRVTVARKGVHIETQQGYFAGAAS